LWAAVVGSTAVFLALPGAFAAPQAGKEKQPDGDKPYVYVYDVGDLVAQKSFWTFRPPFGAAVATGQRGENGEGLPHSLLHYLVRDEPKLAGKFLGKNATHRMQLLNGKKLEVVADRKTHEQVETVLEAFRRGLGISVVVESWLYEVDRRVYVRDIEGKLPRHPGNPPVFVDPATEETERKFLEGPKDKVAQKPFYVGRKPLSANEVTLQDHERGEIASWRTAVPYERNPAHVFRKKETAFAFPGFSISLTAAVSFDRRKTRLELTQKVTQLVEWQKVKALQLLPNQDVKDAVFEVPILQESTFSSTFEAFDGWPVVVPVAWQRPGAGGDRQLVLLFTARIRIEEEERAIQKALEEEKAKKK
jgi:hypothetical protein